MNVEYCSILQTHENFKEIQIIYRMENFLNINQKISTTIYIFRISCPSTGISPKSLKVFTALTHLQDPLFELSTNTLKLLKKLANQILLTFPSTFPHLFLFQNAIFPFNQQHHQWKGTTKLKKTNKKLSLKIPTHNFLKLIISNSI